LQKGTGNPRAGEDDMPAPRAVLSAAIRGGPPATTACLTTASKAS